MATKAKPFPNGMQADILLSGITTIDNPTAKDWHIDVTSTNPLGATYQDLKNRKALGQQPAPSADDYSRNVTLVSATWAEANKHAKYDNLCAAEARPSNRSHSRGRAVTAPRQMRSTTSSPSIYATRVCRGRH
jgi:hypothetical protein